MIRLSDEEAYPLILEKMRGKCILHGATLEEDIQLYFTTNHENYFSNDCFMCVSYFDEYVFVTYTWREDTYISLKKLVKFAKSLYKRYTMKHIPILYTGLTNFYPNHSVEIAPDVWQLKLKD